MNAPTDQTSAAGHGRVPGGAQEREVVKLWYRTPRLTIPIPGVRAFQSRYETAVPELPIAAVKDLCSERPVVGDGRAHRPLGPAPVKDLAAALQLDCDTLSPLLKRIEAAGLIHRTRRPDDERSVEIALTAAGHAMRGDAADVPARFIAATGLDDRVYRNLLKTLQRLTASVERATTTPSS